MRESESGPSLEEMGEAQTELKPSLTVEEKYLQANKGQVNLEEFAFHQDKFKKKAEKHGQRGKVKRLLDGNKNLGALDMAHEEALQENADWDKKYEMAEGRKEMKAEFKEWDEMLQAVVENLK